jgi:hypothetical protein
MEQEPLEAQTLAAVAVAVRVVHQVAQAAQASSSLK